MNNTTEEYTAAIQIITSTIANCEKAQLKFKAGTSQHSLLKNRIKALIIAKSLLTDDDTCKYQDDEGSVQYRRYVPLLHAMKLSLSLIEEQLKRTG